ncbi:MAG: hypothetical protein JNL87_11070 [Burkholderiaceae bacterium]|nr:hypothetical protein [Burkholderiaceae bacterium]
MGAGAAAGGAATGQVMRDCRRSGASGRPGPVAPSNRRAIGSRIQAMMLRSIPTMISRGAVLAAALTLAAGAPAAMAQANGAAAAAAATASKPAARAPAAPANSKATNNKAAAKPAGPAAAASAPPVVVTPAASTPYRGKPSPRPLTTEEKRDTMMAPGELQPERQVAPQISIPLGRKPPDSTHGPARAPGTAPGSSLNDDAVRCAAIADENERAMCRERAGLGSK